MILKRLRRNGGLTVDMRYRAFTTRDHWRIGLRLLPPGQWFGSASKSAKPRKSIALSLRAKGVCPVRTVQSRFIAFRISPEWAKIVEDAAARDVRSLAAYCRAAVIAKLRADGLLADKPRGRDRRDGWP
jgi:hypothetical protein